MLITVFQSLILLPFVHGSHYVAVDGTHFIHNGERVFMSGVNQPFLNFGEDFGNGGFQKGINGFRSTFRFLQENGGNSVSEFETHFLFSPRLYKGSSFIS